MIQLSFGRKSCVLHFLNQSVPSPCGVCPYQCFSGHLQFLQFRNCLLSLQYRCYQMRLRLWQGFTQMDEVNFYEIFFFNMKVEGPTNAQVIELKPRCAKMDSFVYQRKAHFNVRCSKMFLEPFSKVNLRRSNVTCLSQLGQKLV